MTEHKFIQICGEGAVLGSEKDRVWQVECKEKLEDVIGRFLETGVIEYTKIDLMTGKESSVSVKVYPERDKLFLWEATGRFRKRPEKVGGNLIDMKAI